MNYHKMASFWILLSYLVFTGVNPTLPNSLGLIAPFLLFALELYFTHTSKSLELGSQNNDSELEELQNEVQKQNLRSNIENIRRQRTMQEAVSSAGKKVDKKEWSW